MTHEIWKPIPGTRGYEASSLGRIRGPRKILQQCDSTCGYQVVCLGFEGDGFKTVTVHSMVALAFHGPRPDGLDIAHGDHVKTNNRPDNLRYATHKENMNDGHARTADCWLPWDTVEIGQSFRSGSGTTKTRKAAERKVQSLNRAFEVRHIPGKNNECMVTRRPMLDAMTCSATASVGGPQA